MDHDPLHINDGALFQYYTSPIQTISAAGVQNISTHFNTTLVRFKLPCFNIYIYINRTRVEHDG